MIGSHNQRTPSKIFDGNEVFRFLHRINVMEIEIFEVVQELLREALFPEWSFCEMQWEWAERVIKFSKKSTLYSDFKS